MGALEERIEELERGLVCAGDVPADVSERTRIWLESTSRAMNEALAKVASDDTREAATASSTLACTAARVRRAALRESTDVAWLCATARGAGLLERRAAFGRLAVLAKTAGRADREAIERLLARRHATELAVDELLLAAAAGGAAGKTARARLEGARALGERVVSAIGAYAEGVSDVEPLAALPRSDRAELFLHLREHSPVVTAHLCSEIERLVATDAVEELLDLLGALRPAADMRLVPTLVRVVLDDPRPDVRAAATRVLARIDDPRVPPALATSWVRATDLAERLTLAEGLGLWGDRRGAGIVEAALDEPDEHLSRLALAALAALGDPDLAERAYKLALRHPSREVRVAAVRAIGRAADARGLRWLEEIGKMERLPDVLLAAIAMATDAVRARLEARGEAVPERYERRADPLERALARPPGAPATRAHRLLARWTLVRARIARLFGRVRSAENAYARAAAIDPAFVVPPLTEARWRLGRGELAEAVRCFRRVLSIDPGALGRRPRDLALAVEALLRRADDLSAKGRHDMAREIQEDLFALDLTSLSPALRVEVRRRRDRPPVLARAVPHDAETSGEWPAGAEEAS